MISQAQSKALEIACKDIKSDNGEVREGALNLFRALIAQQIGLKVIYDTALELIANDKLRWVGVDLLSDLIDLGRTSSMYIKRD